MKATGRRPEQHWVLERQPVRTLTLRLVRSFPDEYRASPDINI